MNIDHTIVERIADAVAARIQPRVPIEHALWSVLDCAAYMRISESAFRQRIACLPGFPQSIRIPRADGHIGHPRWKAIEVIHWTEAHKEKRSA